MIRRVMYYLRDSFWKTKEPRIEPKKGAKQKEQEGEGEEREREMGLETGECEKQKLHTQTPRETNMDRETRDWRQLDFS